ncbi:DNA-directed RNA polymerases I and III 40 kDa polypeptide [Cantharellus anzutake]|uniref:DNA-directed RNA polymerases I and III 40 kDa polypeptide n=1 Tax=Cantharellus anzutake TaxID=1750568 RepID=UPI001904AD58|nr:DNA-directed RNA polymerases I and III 40 kDa polypeptide [Cantharellus anzutake]KAF8331920.1 DNA-directed RNA polymerases I and III 40 kDa polypeptide [Cantharellus anzutake]
MSSLDDPRRLVHYGQESVSNVSSTDFPGYDPSNDYLWDIVQFKKSLVVKVQRLSDVTIEFDIVGIDTSIANAFRRILIAEVPTMAIEGVYLFNNTSVIQDEVLGHRIGLIPLKVDPTNFEYLTPGGGASDRNTLVFDLLIECKRNPKAKAGETDPEKLYINSNVYSRDLKWKPQGEQDEVFQVPPAPANPNILIAKLRPGQEIEAQFHAHKGKGEEHAKWSPVATASYRLLPHITIQEPILPRSIPKFKNCFPAGVIESRTNPSTGEEEVFVANPRKDTMSREVLRHEEFKDIVKLARVRDFFLCEWALPTSWFLVDLLAIILSDCNGTNNLDYLVSIESAGQMPPEQLFPQAVNVLREKIARIRADIDTYITASISVDVDMVDATE